LAAAVSVQGFGFISDGEISALAGRDIFVHYTAIRINVGFRALWVGEEVSSAREN
jgi:cold shock CspA family protein